MPTIPLPLHIKNLMIGLTGRAVSVVAAPLATMSFDLCGRPIGLNWDGRYFARGMDGRYVEKKWGPDGARGVRPLAEEETLLIQERLQNILDECLRRIPVLHASGNLEMLVRGQRVHGPEKASRLMDSLVAYNSKSLADDEALFRSVYHPIGILPPDQYLSLVVQVTEGCSWNRCSFCHFYRDRAARVRSEEEILSHMGQVKNYFGAALPRRCSVFLGDASALDAPADLLMRVGEEIARVFPEQARPQDDGVGGIYCFGETRRILEWSPEDLAELRKVGLRRIYIGLETGNDELRRWALKPGSADDVRQAVELLKRAGLGVGLISLLGLGGRENGRAHVDSTADLLARLPLDRRDILYFSPLHPEEPSDHERKITSDGWTPCTWEEERGQMAEIVARAGHALGGRTPIAALYDIRDFIY